MAHTQPWTVSLRDVDCFGVIFYARPLEAFQTAIEGLFAASGFPYHDILRAPWSTPVVHAEIEYTQRLELGDTVEIEVVPNIGNRSITFVGRGNHDGDVAFSIERTQVTIDDDTGDPIQVPDTLVEVLSQDAA